MPTRPSDSPAPSAASAAPASSAHEEELTRGESSDGPAGLALVRADGLAGKPRVRREALDEHRRDALKVAFACRRVPRDAMRNVLTGDLSPRAGQLVLARVDRIRQHGRIELVNGRKSQLFPGDEIVLSYGNRYASDQFEGLVPPDLGPCHMVASGGVAARMQVRNRGVRPATEITPLGLLADAEGAPLSLRNFHLPAAGPSAARPFTIAVVGSAMNSGKTTSAAHLVRGFRNADVRVGYAKVTGTGSGGDYWKMRDAGAHAVVDFTDAGFVTTYKAPLRRLEQVTASLIGHLERQQVDAIVVEIADGVFQEETAGLMQSATARRVIDAYLLAVTDSLSAESGARWLAQRELPLLALCGTVNRSPLAVREVESEVGVPLLDLPDLRNPEILNQLIAPPRRAASGH